MQKKKQIGCILCTLPLFCTRKKLSLLAKISIKRELLLFLIKFESTMLSTKREHWKEQQNPLPKGAHRVSSDQNRRC